MFLIHSSCLHYIHYHYYPIEFHASLAKSTEGNERYPKSSSPHSSARPLTPILRCPGCRGTKKRTKKSESPVAGLLDFDLCMYTNMANDNHIISYILYIYHIYIYHTHVYIIRYVYIYIIYIYIYWNVKDHPEISGT
jgi:hypothetical protein